MLQIQAGKMQLAGGLPFYYVLILPINLEHFPKINAYLLRDI